MIQMNKIRQEVPLLTADEEVMLAREIASDRAAWHPPMVTWEKTSKAREKLFLHNQRLVICVAERFNHRGMEMDDLISEGCIGLIRGIDYYDPEKFTGIRFSTYACYWIKQAIQVGLENRNPEQSIRLPRHALTMMAKWRKAERELMISLDREPLFDEVADSIGIDGLKRRTMVLAMSSRRFQNELVGYNDDPPIDAFCMDERRNHEDAIDDMDEQAKLVGTIDRELTQREASVIKSRFGIGREPQTLMKISRHHKCTREWIRQIELKALGKLAACS